MVKHALISPSACHRIGYCPASVALSKDIPNESSPYAEEGTAAHRLCEIDLLCTLENRGRTEAEQAEWIETTAKYPDMFGHVSTYVKYVNEVMGATPLYAAVEVRLPLAELTGEADAYGTADCVVITGDTIHVIDFKYGQGVEVSAKQNVQLCMYALAAMAELDPDSVFYGIANVKLHIVQPRMNNIDQWEISRELLETRFAVHMRRSADRALYLVDHPDEIKVGYPFVVAKGEQAGGDFAEPSDDVCRFCLAKATCPVLRQVTVDALEQEFDDLPAEAPKAELPVQVVEQLKEIPVPDTPERLVRAYEWLPVIRMWIDAVDASMFAMLNTHGETGGYKLVSGRPGPRKWTDAKEAEDIIRRALTVDKAYERKVISPTTAEKLHKKGEIGPKYWARLSNLIGRSDGKPVIAPIDDPRQGLVPSIENDFEDLSESPDEKTSA